MKKLIALTMVACLLMLPFTAFAEPFYLEEAGVTIEVPAGMTAEDVTDESAFGLKMTVDGREDLVYMYSLSWVEEFDGLWIEDLTDEQGQQLLAGIASTMEGPEFGKGEYDGINYLIAANVDGTQLHYVAVLNGWVCDVAVASANQLVDTEIALCAQLLTSITFDGAEEEVAEEEAA